MNRNLLFTVWTFFVITSVLEAKVYFVKQNTTGEGSSWEDAAGDLNSILDIASFGDEIWVGNGVYKPTQGTNRNISFRLKDGVKMYGGFSGTEKLLIQRNWRKNKTVLSGEIGTKALLDNSFSVVYMLNTSSETLIDGFIISDGCANQNGFIGQSRNSGGGIYINGAGIKQISNPEIKNCFFLNNFASYGGAIYNNAMNGGIANPTFIDCLFSNNQAEIDGGAFFNDGRVQGQADPVLRGCSFQSNEATFGGAFMNQGTGGEAHPILIKCDFENNVAYDKGGALFNLKKNGRAYITCDLCRFTDNIPLIKTIFEEENLAQLKEDD